MLQYSQFSTIVNLDLPNRPLHEKILIEIGKLIKPEKLFNRDKCLDKIDRLLRSNDYNQSNL